MTCVYCDPVDIGKLVWVKKISDNSRAALFKNEEKKEGIIVLLEHRAEFTDEEIESIRERMMKTFPHHDIYYKIIIEEHAHCFARWERSSW